MGEELIGYLYKNNQKNMAGFFSIINKHIGSRVFSDTFETASIIKQNMDEIGVKGIIPKQYWFYGSLEGKQE